MKVDGGLGLTPDIEAIAGNARAQEAAGYDGIWTAETSHDPFLPLVVAAANTERLELGTAIAVAFARNPMLLANIGWDLQAMSNGRFNLGLGSQIKPHITKRFSMEWSKPAARMRDYIQAVKACFRAFKGDERLKHEGPFYNMDLLPPQWSPPKHDYHDIKVDLG